MNIGASNSQPPDPRSRRRIVQVCLGYHPETGGSALAVKQFAQALGGSIVNFTDRTTTPAAPDVATVPISTSLPGRKFSWTRDPALIRAQPMLEDADLIICHTLFRYHIQWASKIAFRNRIPFWVVLHGSLDPFVFTYRKFEKELWMRFVGNAILSKASAVICATQREKQKAELRGVPMNTRVILWQSTDREARSSDQRGEEIRRELGISPSDRALLFLGRLHGTKQPLETIQALYLSGAQNVHLIMVGSDETVTAAECRKYASDLGMTNVHLIGPVFDDRKWDYFAAADGYISLSLKENFGFTVAEALLAGRPVILSGGIDLASNLTGVGCGWLLENDAPESAAKAILEFAVLGGDDLRSSGIRGRAWARTNLNPGRFRAGLNDLFAETRRQRTGS